MYNNTFIIVTWNNAAEIKQLLDSIQKYERNSPIIIVDNDSKDRTTQLVEKSNRFGNITLLKLDHNVGFARANNIAFKQVKTPYVTFINPDTQLNSPIIQLLEKELIGNIGMIGVQLNNTDGSLQPSIYCFQTPGEIFIEQFGIGKVLPEHLRERFSPENSQHNKKRLVDWILGAFMFTKADYYRRVGGFSEDYFLYSEDMDLCYKYHQKRLQILFDPTKTITHIGGSSEKQTDSVKSIKLLRSFCTFARKFDLPANIRALYWSYMIKNILFKLVDKKRAQRYQNNLAFLKKQLGE